MAATQGDLKVGEEWKHLYENNAVIHVNSRGIGSQLANTIVQKLRSPSFSGAIWLSRCTYKEHALEILLKSVGDGSIGFCGCEFGGINLNTAFHPPSSLAFFNTRFGIGNSTIIFNNLHLYSSISFYGCEFGTETTILFRNFIQTQTSLSHLHIVNCPKVSKISISNSCISNLSSLTDLNLGKLVFLIMHHLLKLLKYLHCRW